VKNGSADRYDPRIKNLTFCVGTGLRANGGKGGAAPPLREYWVERVATTDRLTSGARLRTEAILV